MKPALSKAEKELNDKIFRVLLKEFNHGIGSSLVKELENLYHDTFTNALEYTADIAYKAGTLKGANDAKVKETKVMADNIHLFLIDDHREEISQAYQDGLVQGECNTENKLQAEFDKGQQGAYDKMYKRLMEHWRTAPAHKAKTFATQDSEQLLVPLSMVLEALRHELSHQDRSSLR